MIALNGTPHQPPFETTQWSILDAYRRADTPEGRAELLARLAGIYHGPVRSYLIRRGIAPDLADELTQRFFTDVVLGRALFDRADRSRGRFRPLLRRSLENLIIDRRREDRAGPRIGATDPGDLGAAAEPVTDTLFDREYAQATLLESFRRCETHFKQSGREAHWRAFEARVIRPIVMDAPRPSLKEMQSRLGFSSVATVASAIDVVRIRLRDIYRSVVAETVRGEDAVEAELEFLDGLLRGGAASKGARKRPNDAPPPV